MKYIYSIACLLLFNYINSQSVSIYTENFEGSSTNLPTGWVSTPSTSGWTITSSNTSTAYVGASGANNIKIDNNSPTASYSISTKSISTVGYSSITVSWGARLTTNFAPSSISSQLYYSTNNGGSWLSVAYTEASSGSVWALNGPVILPAGANNQASLMFQLVANITNNANGTYRIDDFQVKGTSISTSVSESPLSQIMYCYVSDDHILKYGFNAETTLLKTIKLIDLSGKELLTKTITSDDNNTIQLQNFYSGIYFAKFESADGREFFKKIVLY